MSAPQFRLDRAPETVPSAIESRRVRVGQLAELRDFRAGVDDVRGRLVSVTYGDGTKQRCRGNRTTQVITVP